MEGVLAVVVGFALTTVAGGWWASQLQQRSWFKQNDMRMREADSERAAAACTDITSLLDRRLYRMQRLLWAAIARGGDSTRNEELERRRQDYIEVLIEWNENLNMNLSRIGAWFGDGARAKLEGLYETYKQVGQEVEAIVKAVQANQDVGHNADRVAAQFEGREPGTLNDRVFQFGLTLMGQLREGQVGRHAPGFRE